LLAARKRICGAGSGCAAEITSGANPIERWRAVVIAIKNEPGEHHRRARALAGPIGAVHARQALAKNPNARELAGVEQRGAGLGFQELDTLQDDDLGHQRKAVPNKIRGGLNGGFATIAPTPVGAVVRSRKLMPSVLMSVQTTRRPAARRIVAMTLASSPHASHMPCGNGSTRANASTTHAGVG